MSRGDVGMITVAKYLDGEARSECDEHNQGRKEVDEFGRS
jgi:hypothetical protein